MTIDTSRRTYLISVQGATLHVRRSESLAVLVSHLYSLVAQAAAGSASVDRLALMGLLSTLPPATVTGMVQAIREHVVGCEGLVDQDGDAVELDEATWPLFLSRSPWVVPGLLAGLVGAAAPGGEADGEPE